MKYCEVQHSKQSKDRKQAQHMLRNTRNSATTSSNRGNLCMTSWIVQCTSVPVPPKSSLPSCLRKLHKIVFWGVCSVCHKSFVDHMCSILHVHIHIHIYIYIYIHTISIYIYIYIYVYIYIRYIPMRCSLCLFRDMCIYAYI